MSCGSMLSLVKVRKFVQCSIVVVGAARACVARDFPQGKSRFEDVDWHLLAQERR